MKLDEDLPEGIEETPINVKLTFEELLEQQLQKEQKPFESAQLVNTKHTPKPILKHDSSNKKKTFLKRGSSQKYDPVQALRQSEGSKQYKYYADNFDGEEKQ